MNPGSGGKLFSIRDLAILGMMVAALEKEVLAEETMMVALAVAAMMEVLEGFIRVILLV